MNRNLCRAVRSTMRLIHQFGIMFNEEVIAFLSKEDAFSSLIADCIFPF